MMISRHLILGAFLIVIIGGASVSTRTGRATTTHQIEDRGASHDTARDTEIVVRRIGIYTLHIPRPYLYEADSYQGSFGYIHIQALLPCLDPESPRDRAAYLNSKQGMGRVLDARLMTWTTPQLSGKRQLELWLAGPDFLKIGHPAYKVPVNNGADVPGTRFRRYQSDLAGPEDLFVLKGSKPLLLFECKPPANLKSGAVSNVPYPNCSVRERIWGGEVLLEYRFSRAYLDDDLTKSVEIDARLKALLTSFATEKPAEAQADERGGCQ